MPYVQTVSERLVYSFNIFITNSIYQPAYIEPTRHGVMRPLMPEQVSHDVRWVFTPLLPPHSCELMVHQYRPIAGVQPSRVNARTDKKRVVFFTASCKRGRLFSAVIGDDRSQLILVRFLLTGIVYFAFFIQNSVSSSAHPM